VIFSSEWLENNQPTEKPAYNKAKDKAYLSQGFITSNTIENKINYIISTHVNSKQPTQDAKNYP